MKQKSLQPSIKHQEYRHQSKKSNCPNVQLYFSRKRRIKSIRRRSAFQLFICHGNMFYLFNKKYALALGSCAINYPEPLPHVSFTQTKQIKP